MVSRFKLCGFIASVLGVLFLMREAFEVDQGAVLLSSEQPLEQPDDSTEEIAAGRAVPAPSPVSPAPAKFKRRVPPVVRKVSKQLEVVCQKQASYFCKHIKASFAQGCDHAVNGEIAKSVLSTLIEPEPGSSGPYSVGVSGELGIILGGMNKGQGLGFLLSPLGKTGQERVRFIGFDISPSNVQTSTKVLDKLGFRHTVFNLGMSDRNGTLCTINPNEGRGRLDAAEGFKAAGNCETKVHLTTIEQTRANVGIEQTMFVMIDTEGHDLSVIFGLGLETTKERYPVIQFELGTAWCLEEKMAANVHRWRQSEASQYLQDLGYDLYSMNCDHGDGGQSFKKPKGGCLMGPLNAPMMDFVNCEGHPQCMTGNMLAVYRPLASKNPLRSTLEKLTKGKSCKWN